MSFRVLPDTEPYYTRRTYGDPYTSSPHRLPRRQQQQQQQARPKLGLARAIFLLLPTIFLFARSACIVTGCQGTAVCTWIDNTPSSIASGITHLPALSLQLLALLHSLSAATIQLPGLLQRARANMLARLTALANNARSLSGTPACPSADCVRIAARSKELIASFRRVSEVVIVVMGVVAVLVAAHYANKYFAMILRKVINSISTTYSGKWEPGARSPPSSPVRRSPPVTAAAAQRSSLLLGGRPRVRLERLAEEASVLLEVFSKNVADEALGEDQKTMIIKTLRNVLDIKKELKIVVPEMDEREDNKCVICYDNVADMVVLPCRHLAMCMTCCDGMGIRESGISTYSTAKCPICRTVVTKRMKIFRS